MRLKTNLKGDNILLIISVIIILISQKGFGQNSDNKRIFDELENLVNPVSGDLSYALPLLTVPGPGGGFPLELTYAAGIKLHQQASWVGLGWELNPGSIDRFVSQFPDDFVKDTLYTMYAGTGNFSAHFNLLDEYQRNNLVGPMGNGSIKKINDNKYQLNFTKGEIVFGLLYQQEMPVRNALKFLPHRTYKYWEPEFSNLAYSSQSFEQFGGNSFQNVLGQNSNKNLLELRDFSHLSDVYQHQQFGAQYYENLSPVYLSPDHYVVTAGDITGQIAPVRFDNPSVATPNQIINKYPNGKVPTTTYRITVPQQQKVQFRYLNDPASKYDHHIPTNGDYSFNYTVEQIAEAEIKALGIRCSHKFLHTIKYLTQPSHMATMKSTSDPSEGYYYNSNKAELAQSKHVSWYTNEELLDGSAVNDGLMIIPSTSSIDTANDYPAQAIAAFKIVNPAGLTYHFSQAAYIEGQASRTAKGSSSAVITFSEKYAYRWLLTGITGPDFKDENSNHMIDTDDKGYFVKLEYGRLTDEYIWRYPYEGNLITIHDMNELFETGLREDYYLNSISTATHTAFFVKDYRKDSRSHWGADPDGRASELIKSSLLLKEIIIMDNNNIPSGFDYNETDPMGLYKNHEYQNVLLIQDVDPFNEFNTDILKKIKFNYDYSLCEDSPNSFAYNFAGATPSYGSTWLGKLTLKQVQSIYPSPTGLTTNVPPYNFHYQEGEYNPNYDQNYIDGWGYYYPSSTNTHIDRTPTNSSSGVGWNLSKIELPMGRVIGVEYERDEYSSVMGNTEKVIYHFELKDGTTSYDKDTEIMYFKNSKISDIISQGDKVKFTGKSYHSCEVCIIAGHGQCSCHTEYREKDYTDYNLVVESVHSPNGIKFTTTFPTFPPYNPPPPCGDPDDCYLSHFDGYIEIEKASKYGDNLKVTELSISNSINTEPEYYLNYEYSEAVASGEPELCRTIHYDFYNTHISPEPKVYYGQCQVKYNTGLLANDNTEKSIEYGFITPSQDMISVQLKNYDFATICNFGTLPTSCIFPSYWERYGEWKSEVAYLIKDRTAEIGLPEYINIYNKYGDKISGIVYEYSGLGHDNYNDNRMGVLTQASVLADKTFQAAIGMPDLFDAQGYLNCPNNHCMAGADMRKQTRLISTIVEKKIPILKKTINKFGNQQNYFAYSKFDFTTGLPLETEYRKDGKKYRTKNIPASSSYPSMGSKYENSSNAHLLDPIESTKTFFIDNEGKEQLVASSAITYKYSWEDVHDAWRKHRSFNWNGELNMDGTYITSPGHVYEYKDYPNGSHWELTKEISRYDDFSIELETYDGSRNYSSSRRDPEGKNMISTAKNARFVEFTHSGAELESVGSNYEGDVDISTGATRKEASTISSPSMMAHSGKYVFEVPDGEELKFIGDLGATPLLVDSKKYHFSVWEHESSSSSACTLRVKYYGGTIGPEGVTNPGYLNEVVKYIDLACSPPRYGDWILHQSEIEIPSPSSGVGITKLEVILENNSGSVKYFDDFRFQPNGSIVEYSVYDDRSRLTHILNNQNISTKYTFDPDGAIDITYREVEYKSSNDKGGYKKSTEIEYNYPN